jgi:hypothetical protein
VRSSPIRSTPPASPTKHRSRRGRPFPPCDGVGGNQEGDSLVPVSRVVAAEDALGGVREIGLARTGSDRQILEQG